MINILCFRVTSIMYNIPLDYSLCLILCHNSSSSSTKSENIILLSFKKEVSTVALNSSFESAFFKFVQGCPRCGLQVFSTMARAQSYWQRRGLGGNHHSLGETTHRGPQDFLLLNTSLMICKVWPMLFKCNCHIRASSPKQIVVLQVSPSSMVHNCSYCSLIKM